MRFDYSLLKNKKGLLQFLAIFVSAILLSLAYPPVAASDIAFFALVPLLLILRQATPKKGFCLAFFFGFFFRLINLSWLWALKDNGGPFLLVFFGLIALSAYTALYTGLFGLTLSWVWSITRKPYLPKPILFYSFAWICEALLWVGQEHLVSIVLSGFPWNPLAATQYKNLALLSTVSLFGAATLSFIIVLINSGITSLLSRISTLILYKTNKSSELMAQIQMKPKFRCLSLPLMLAIIVMIIAWWRGIDYVKKIDASVKDAPKYRVAVIHPNAPCIFERGGEEIDAANDTLVYLTSIAAGARPDITIWPETSLPGYSITDPDAQMVVAESVHNLGAPLIAGGLDLVSRYKGDTEGALYNAALHFDKAPGGRFRILNLYYKQHLVPFGEFIPLESKFDFLKRMAPTGFSCEAGTKQTYFTVSPRPVKSVASIQALPPETNGTARISKNVVALSFNPPEKNSSSNTTEHITHSKAKAKLAPLICFEDAFPYITRKAAQEGASALVVVVNDAWFTGTSLAEQHLAQAVLRAVETGLPVIRATNSGVSSVILPNGRITKRLGTGAHDEPAGFFIEELGIEDKPKQTLYTRIGDNCLAIPCAGLLIGILFAMALIRHQKRKLAKRNS